MGITQHLHGVENVESIVNLALLRGMIGRKNAGLLPLRGHSNVQGMGSMGVTPSLKKQVLRNMENLLDFKYPQKKGMDTLSCLHASERGEIDFALFMGGNLYAATPDSNFSISALSNIPFKVFMTTTINESHIFDHSMNVIVEQKKGSHRLRGRSRKSRRNWLKRCKKVFFPDNRHGSTGTGSMTTIRRRIKSVGIILTT